MASLVTLADLQRPGLLSLLGGKAGAGKAALLHQREGHLDRYAAKKNSTSADGCDPLCACLATVKSAPYRDTGLAVIARPRKCYSPGY